MNIAKIYDFKKIGLHDSIPNGYEMHAKDDKAIYIRKVLTTQDKAKIEQLRKGGGRV